jgi:hypothetical protein
LGNIKYSFFTIRFSIFFCLSLCWQCILAQDSLDICKTDIISYPSFNGRYIKVFGIHLGITIEDARKTLAENDCYDLFLKQDKFSNNRFYLYQNLSGDSISNLIGYCKWESDDGGLKEITLFEGAAQCLHPANNCLFHSNPNDSFSSINRNFLGRPAYQRTELDIPSIGLKTTRFVYPQRSMMIEEKLNGGKLTYGIVFYTI